MSETKHECCGGKNHGSEKCDGQHHGEGQCRRDQETQAQETLTGAVASQGHHAETGGHTCCRKRHGAAHSN